MYSPDNNVAMNKEKAGLAGRLNDSVQVNYLNNNINRLEIGGAEQIPMQQAHKCT